MPSLPREHVKQEGVTYSESFTFECFHDFPREEPSKVFCQQDLGADELSECVQDFYQNLADRLMTHFKGRIAEVATLPQVFKTIIKTFSTQTV